MQGKHIIVTAGPTHEPIDPVRYIANRSSGKQGFAIAGALAAKGARVTLIAGPVTLATPPGVARIDVETAREMAAAVEAALPADVAIMVAAVADWRVESAAQKIKKDGSGTPPVLRLVENPDILAELARSPRRPRLLIGFAAETENVIANATSKLEKKGCDWIVANDVSGDVMGGAANTVHLITADGVESWERMAKGKVADKLAGRIETALAGNAPYHAHIYFSADEHDAAAALRENFLRLTGSGSNPRILFVGRMTEGKAGPHPIPQYEIHFPARSVAGVRAAIEASGLRALIHPLTNDDLADHTILGTWIGEPIELDLTTLDPPGQNQGIPRFGKTDF